MRRLQSETGNFILYTAGLILLFFFSFLLFATEFQPAGTPPGIEPDLTGIFDNQLVSDTDNDSVPDNIAARFLVGSRTNAVDVETAAGIAARLGFESCAMDPDLCVANWREVKEKKVAWLITFRTVNLKKAGQVETGQPAVKEDCGVRVYREKGINIIEIFGVTPAGRRYAALNFFSRFPYMWDITGRETGELWQHMRLHILSLLPEATRDQTAVRITAVHYKYLEKPGEEVRRRRRERLALSGTIRREGEVDRVKVAVSVPGEAEKIAAGFKNCVDAHTRGEQTHILNYAGVREVVVQICTSGGKTGESLTIPRIAVPQRFLNPVGDPFFFKKKVAVKETHSDIAGFYSGTGIYRDNDGDGCCDTLVSRIIYDGDLPYRVINLAARIGLEECAVSLPFILSAAAIDLKTVKNLDHPVLIGSRNRFVQYLTKIGRASKPQLKPDEGFIRFSSGFNPGGAYIIAGSTPAGENAALQYAAAALPFISSRFPRPGNPLWLDLSREIELFFSKKNDASTAVYGILQVDKQKEAFRAADLEKVMTRLYTIRRVEKLDQFLHNRLQSYLPIKNGANPQSTCPPDRFSVQTGGRLEAGSGFSDHCTPRWEVDEFREIFTRQVLPELQVLVREQANKPALAGAGLGTGQPGTNPGLFIDLRLSEPREVLEKQVSWIEENVLKAGFKKEQVHIRAITAYKQGFHWIKDHVLPALKALRPARIRIAFAPFVSNRDETGKYRPEPVRWLQELYPVDEIVAGELDIPLESVHFVKDETLTGAIYELTACSRDGENIFKETFTPFTTEIPFQNRFLGWGKVTVNMGGIRVEWDNKEIFSTAVEPDPLRLWNVYQGKILPKITEMVQKQAGGPLKLEDQPFFDKLQVNVWMSEPDYRLGLDEELVSSLESFHEDLYFNTLDYFQGLVKKDPEMDVADPLMAQRWAAPGNIVPIIHPSRTGQGPLMKTEVTGLKSLATKVEMNFHYLDVKDPVKVKQPIIPLKKINAPRLTCIVVDKNSRVNEAEYTLEFFSEEELSDAVDMLGILEDLQKEKLFNNTFCYPGIPAVRFVLKAPEGLQNQFVLNIQNDKSDSPGGGNRRTVIANATSRPNVEKDLSKEELEQSLAKVMSPEDTLKMAEQLGTLPGIDFYVGGYSFQGRPVPVLEIGLKPDGKLVSLRKITTYKPTVFILGRQHANEISSTNYGFNIAYLLVRDPAYREYLRRLNIVIEPMENPDGSALAVELQKLTPHHMLHAGRYSALGTDIGYHVNKPDTLITEAKVRQKLYDRWQPDIFLNNHGYPSHEWVQQFSNYTPYLFRAYWVPRGWYYFHTGLDSIGSPLHKKAGERIVEIISGKMRGDKEIFETNRRIYDRYRRWAERWQPHIHYLELYDGTNIYKKRRGATSPRLSPRRAQTVLEAVPEAMDETARDEWLRLSIRQGTLFVTSFFDLAIESEEPIERIEEESGDVVHLQIVRYRPFRVK